MFRESELKLLLLLRLCNENQFNLFARLKEYLQCRSEHDDMVYLIGCAFSSDVTWYISPVEGARGLTAARFLRSGTLYALNSMDAFETVKDIVWHDMDTVGTFFLTYHVFRHTRPLSPSSLMQCLQWGC